MTGSTTCELNSNGVSFSGVTTPTDISKMVIVDEAEKGPYHHALLPRLTNTPYHRALLPHLTIAPYYHTLLTHLTTPPYHHALPTRLTTTPYHHASPPHLTTTPHHHALLPHLTTTPYYHHALLPPRLTTTPHHQASPPHLTTTHYYHALLPRLTTTPYYHYILPRLPPRLTTTPQAGKKTKYQDRRMKTLSPRTSCAILCTAAVGTVSVFMPHRHRYPRVPSTSSLFQSGNFLDSPLQKRPLTTSHPSCNAYVLYSRTQRCELPPPYPQSTHLPC